MFFKPGLLSLCFILVLSTPAVSQGDYNLYISTMEVVDKNSDGRKDGLEVFYILKKGSELIELSPEGISYLEAFLYEDKEDKPLISFWRGDDLKGFFSSQFIYLPFREGFAYNIYIDKIVPAVLEIRMVFNDEREVSASLKDRVSFLSY